MHFAPDEDAQDYRQETAFTPKNGRDVIVYRFQTGHVLEIVDPRLLIFVASYISSRASCKGFLSPASPFCIGQDACGLPPFSGFQLRLHLSPSTIYSLKRGHMLRAQSDIGKTNLKGLECDMARSKIDFSFNSLCWWIASRRTRIERPRICQIVSLTNFCTEERLIERKSRRKR